LTTRYDIAPRSDLAFELCFGNFILATRKELGRAFEHDEKVRSRQQSTQRPHETTVRAEPVPQRIDREIPPAALDDEKTTSSHERQRIEEPTHEGLAEQDEHFRV
jgi:hypothetical protein